MTPTFGLGQRWISNTEPELGLGVVTLLDGRHVSLHFPAAGEDRKYAEDNCPLSRMLYREGDKISDHSGENFTVTGQETVEGFITYQVINEQGDAVELPESLLNSFVQLNTPVERLFAGQLDKLNRFKLRIRAANLAADLAQQPFNGLLGGRVQLLPHQFYIAQEVGLRHAPRVLLADEVGLGKTIEAGLILHHQLQTGRAKRALIVVPDSLVHQWLVEMMRRFNLNFTVLDEQRCLDLQESVQTDDYGEFEEVEAPSNPFESAQLILCPLSFLTDNPTRQEQALECEWDLLIVDEAHHLEWQDGLPSPEYSCVEALAEKSSGLLLLTATPEQLGMESHFARLRLLDPARYHNLDTFLKEESQYGKLSETLDKLLAEDGVERLANEQALQDELAELIGKKEVAEWNSNIAAAAKEEQAATLHRLALQLLDQHGTGRVLFRNTRSAVKGFPKRVLHRHALSPPEAYGPALEFGELDDMLNPEMLLGANWPAEDTRVAWLVDWLKQHRSEKVLVICAHADTALDLELHLNLRAGLASAVFHEGLSLIDRDRAAAYFAESQEEDGAQVLVCSEIGSEGRNFQFASHLVLFDLPFNPDLLEQRIGRLDRIGQQGDVNIHVPYYEDSAQEGLLDWYDEGVSAFNAPCMAGQAIAQKFSARLQEALESGDELGLATVIEETAAFASEARAALEAGRNHLLELNSCDRPVAEALVEAVDEFEDKTDLTIVMDAVFDQFGVEQEEHSAGAFVLRPGDHMQEAHFPALPDEGCTATYDRSLALSRDDIYFLSHEHPMVTGALDMILNSEYGNASLCTLSLKPLKPGSLLVELNYRLQCPAPKSLQLGRYLAGAGQRLLISDEGREIGKVVTVHHLDKLCNAVPRKTAQQLVRTARPQIEGILKAAEKAIVAKEQALATEAQNKAASSIEAELQRLSHLAAKNPNIRQEELSHLADKKEQVLKLLGKAKLSLDSLRVCIVT
mgnify:CR=1 FL=1